MREIRTSGLMRGKSHRRQHRGVGLYSTYTIDLMTTQELRILVIEDNPNWVAKTVQILRLLGYRNVETAELLKDGVGVSA